MKSKVVIFTVLITILISLILSEEVLAVEPTPSPTPTPTLPQLVDYAVSASAGPGGTISPSGVGFFAYPGSSFNFIITPNEGYQILDVSDNGVSKGSLQTYKLWNVQTNHQILATFSKVTQTSTPTPTSSSTPTPTSSSSTSPSGSQSAELLGLGWVLTAILALVSIIVAAVVVYAFVSLSKKRNSR